MVASAMKEFETSWREANVEMSWLRKNERFDVI